MASDAQTEAERRYPPFNGDSEYNAAMSDLRDAFIAGWEAATQASEERIAELERRNAEQASTIREYQAHAEHMYAFRKHVSDALFAYDNRHRALSASNDGRDGSGDA